jgi:hypothetical protein
MQQDQTTTSRRTFLTATAAAATVVTAGAVGIGTEASAQRSKTRPTVPR